MTFGKKFLQLPNMIFILSDASSMQSIKQMRFIISRDRMKLCNEEEHK